MYRDVGMAVPKTTATRCRDRAYKHCTNNPIPTSFFHVQYRLPVILQHKEICHVQKKRYRDGLFVQCLYALSLHLVAVVFGTAIPTSLYIFGKCFIYFNIYTFYRKHNCWHSIIQEGLSIIHQGQAHTGLHACSCAQHNTPPVSVVT